jgi:predicted nucleic acid-binding protein
MSYLLDTNIVSELRRRTPDPNVQAWFDSVRAEDLYLSVLTIGEIRQGVERLRLREPVAAEQLDGWLAGLVSAYRDRIVPVDAAIADRWGRLNAPDRIPAVDGLLAATALAKEWTFVTRNVADVERTGVTTVNPFVLP